MFQERVVKLLVNVCFGLFQMRSWEIGSPPTGGVGKMVLFCVVPTSVIHI